MHVSISRVDCVQVRLRLRMMLQQAAGKTHRALAAFCQLSSQSSPLVISPWTAGGLQVRRQLW